MCWPLMAIRRLAVPFLAPCHTVAADHLAPGSVHYFAQWMLHRGFKRQAIEVRSGNVLDLEGQLLKVVRHEHSQGRGRQLGNVQLELRAVRGGQKQLERRRPYDMLEVLHLVERPFQFLYRQGNQLVLMDPATYEQETVAADLFDGSIDFLVGGCEVSLGFAGGEAVSGKLPTIVTLAVAKCEPYVRGDSAVVATKQATLETGARLVVPPFVAPGERVVVNTRERAFVRRAS